MTQWLADLWTWIDDRLPVQRAWDTHMAKYYAPKNFNFWYFFGVLSLLVLVNQLLTGIWLTMHYDPTADGAFASVEYIMRDVPYGNYLRYMHSTGASAFFLVVYLHMFRGLMYGSYRKPRELLWIIGMLIFVALMAEAFLGYVLPWGNMSYWGAQVIVNLFGAIPYVGEDLVQWIRGDYLISGATLTRFFALHVVAVPLALVMLVFVHILALHEVGSLNPDGVEIKKHKDENGIPKDGIPFFPYYLPVHDLKAIVVFLFAFCGVMFFMPEFGGLFIEHANFEPANNLKTPENIAPVWYFTPFYSMLRAVTLDLGGPLNSRFLGFVVMAMAIVILFFLPWLDHAKSKSVRYKGFIAKVLMVLFAANFVVLGRLGLLHTEPARVLLAQIGTYFYFVFFLTMPVWTNVSEKTFIGKALCTVLGLGLLYMVIASVGVDKIYEAIIHGEGEHGIPWFLVFYGLVLGVLTLLLPSMCARDAEKEVPERVQMKGLSKPLVLGGLVLFAVFILVPLQAAGADAAHACGDIACDHFEPDLTDQESLQRGAKWFDNYCFGCHSLKYSRYERVADDLGIPHELMVEHMVPRDLEKNEAGKIGGLMSIAMEEDKAKQWFVAVPPDLSLETRLRSPSWVYTYLRNFHRDDSRTTGASNRVFENAMPHALLELQGLLECAPGPQMKTPGIALRDYETGQVVISECADLVEGKYKGTVSREEFDQVVADLVNYMAYVAEPGAEQRKHVGVYVMLFLGVFLVFAILLDREYWRNIH